MPVTLNNTKVKYKDNNNQFVGITCAIDPSTIIDDTAGDGDTGKVWSADKTIEAIGEMAPVRDVQVNGSSILNDDVANLPIANDTDIGLAKFSSGYGVGINPQGQTYLSQADSAQIKAGTAGFKPIAPEHQHEAVFWGLAKLAGVDLASGSDTVGVYPEAAKKAICAMLGVQYDAPFRQIKQITITEETGDIVIDRDEDNQEFELSEIVVYFDSMLATAGSNGAITVNGMNNKFCSISNLYNPTTPEKRFAHITIKGGRIFGETGSSNFTTTYGSVNKQITQYMCGILECGLITSIRMGSLNAHKFTSGTITIYGR